MRTFFVVFFAVFAAAAAVVTVKVYLADVDVTAKIIATVVPVFLTFCAVTCWHEKTAPTPKRGGRSAEDDESLNR